MNRIDVFSVLIRLDGGGAERSVSRMVDPLASRGVSLTRFAIDGSLPGEESDPEKTLVRGSKRGLTRLIAAAFSLAAVIRRQRPDVVHLNCEAPEIVGFMSRLLTIGQPYGIVVTDHSMKSWSGARTVFGRMLRGALKSFGAVYVNCFLSDSPISKAPVILNPTGDASPLVSAKAPYPRLVVVGRVIDSKRIDQVLVAASSCPWPHKIIVIGAGAAMTKLNDLATELGLEVDFHGHKADPWSLVEENDVFVTASAFEGEPLTLIEALQRKLPVLASDIPAHLKVLGTHAGIFASPLELSEKLNECLQSTTASDRFRLQTAHLDRILRERDPEHIADQWQAIYRSLIPSGRANAS